MRPFRRVLPGHNHHGGHAASAVPEAQGLRHGDFKAVALRTLAIGVAVPSLAALVAFLRKPQRARAEDCARNEPDPAGRAPTHRSP